MGSFELGFENAHAWHHIQADMRSGLVPQFPWAKSVTLVPSRSFQGDLAAPQLTSGGSATQQSPGGSARPGAVQAQAP